MSDGHTIEIDGRKYALDGLSDAAKEQLASLQVTDQEIARLHSLLGIAQTARIAYANALRSELPKN